MSEEINGSIQKRKRAGCALWAIEQVLSSAIDCNPICSGCSSV